MFYTKGLCGVKIYCGDESDEPVPIKISQNDMSIDLNITTNYEFEQDVESGKWYLYADGIRVCEIFPKTEK